MVVSGTALLAACLAFIAYDWTTFRSNAARNLSIQAQIVGENTASALLFNDPDSARKTLSTLQASTNIAYAGVFSLDGNLLAIYRRADVSRIPQTPILAQGQTEVHRFENGNVLVVQAILLDGKRVGTIQIESDLTGLYVRLENYGGIAALVLMGSLFAALLLSSISRRAVSVPIVQLAETARMVARERNYSVRAAAAAKEGELQILIEAFNDMLEQIQKRDEDLQTAREDLERRVQERTAQLSAANKELEAFCYSVSHDLRAPLRSIDGFSQAVLEDYGDKLDSAGVEHLQRVRAAAVRMGVLIDDLLKLSRVTRAELNREKTDLSAMAQSIVGEFQEADPKRKVDFSIRQGLTVDGDPRLLRVVLENLLSNAWKYTSRHEHARIEFGLSKANGKSIFFVRDDGAGFDQQFAGRLFGVFQRLHGMKEFPGTGVGLATVQRIVNRHGGEIWAEAEVEKGATFYFSLSN